MSFLTSLLGSIGSAAGTVGSAIGSTAGTIGSALGSTVGTIGKGLLTAGETAAKGVGTAAETVGKGLTNTWSNVVGTTGEPTMLQKLTTQANEATPGAVGGELTRGSDWGTRLADQGRLGEAASNIQAEAGGWSKFMKDLRDIDESNLLKLMKRNIKLGGVPIQRYHGPEESKYVALKSKFVKGRGPAIESTEAIKWDEKDKALIEALAEEWKAGQEVKAEKKALEGKPSIQKEELKWSTEVPRELEEGTSYGPGWNPDEEDWDDYVSRYWNS